MLWYKIEKIVLLIKEEIVSKYSKSEIFRIFKNNKRILLFLFREDIIFDEFIIKKFIKDKFAKRCYPQYFSLEMKPFLNEEWFLNSLNGKSKLLKQIEKEIPEKFIENREKGENEDEICKIIQNDSIDEFISFVNKTDYPLTSEVPESIYETNLLLIEKRASLIEYATFFGSVQIFKYLYKNKVEPSPSLWLYAIHGIDEELIHILEDINVSNEEVNDESENEENKSENDEVESNNKKSIYSLLKEAIKCHHNDVANYIINNYIPDAKLVPLCLKYVNFFFFYQENELVNQSLLYYSCIYNYFKVVEFFLRNNSININQKIILNLKEFNNIFKY